MDRSSGVVMRTEDGIRVGYFEDGTPIILPPGAMNDGELVKFDDEIFYTIEENQDETIYIVVLEKDGKDVYYRYDSDSEEDVNMVRCIEADPELRTNDFEPLRALIKNLYWFGSDLDGYKVVKDENRYAFNDDHNEYWVYDDYSAAYDDACDDEESLLDGVDKDTLKHLIDTLGYDSIDEKEIEDALKESYEYYYEDLDEEDAITELIKYGVVDDNDFETDEDGEVDYSQPKFDYEDYQGQYASAVVNGINDVVKEYIDQYGYDGIEDYIDFSKMARSIVDADGVGNILAYYDGVERVEDIDTNTYYIYRVG